MAGRLYRLSENSAAYFLHRSTILILSVREQILRAIFA